MCNTHLINCDFKVELSYKLRNSLTYNFKFWYFMAKMQLFPFTKFITFLYCEIRGFWFSICLHSKTSDAKVQDVNFSQIYKIIEKTPPHSVLKIEMSNTDNTE